MKVQTRILLLLLGIVVVFAAGWIFIKARQHARSREIFQQRADVRGKAFDEFLQRREEPLATLVKDYTNLDAMVRALRENDVAWIKGDISDGTWEKADAHAIWIYRLDRTLFFSANRLYAEGPAQEISLPPAAFDALSRAHFMHFFVCMPQGLMEICGATVHPSSDGWRQTPPQGFFLAGRLWNRETIFDLGAGLGQYRQQAGGRGERRRRGADRCGKRGDRVQLSVAGLGRETGRAAAGAATSRPSSRNSTGRANNCCSGYSRLRVLLLLLLGFSRRLAGSAGRCG